jgi:hypothetical protein
MLLTNGAFPSLVDKVSIRFGFDSFPFPFPFPFHCITSHFTSFRLFSNR